MADQQFWTSFYNMATHAGAKYPELLAAQASLESGWGEHLSGKNNYFGIKGSPGTVVSTQEWSNGELITIEAEFKDFATKLECVQYLVDRWYKDYKGYKGVNRADDREEAAYLLKEEGYATDPQYPQKLIEMMDRMQPDATESGEDQDEYFLLDAVKYYKEELHQVEAWMMLEESLEPELLEAFKAAYRNKPPMVEQPDPMWDEEPEAEGGDILLDVPYFYQYDSTTGHGERMCFSSSMAMALDFVDPAKIDGDDDWYLGIVLYYGDTVSSDAQIKAARSLGYDASFHTDGTQAKLEELLDSGVPIPIGVLHHGDVSNPTGGGHWVCLVGHDETHFHVHDPAGEMDLVAGGYPKQGPTDGKFQRYSKKNLMKRWLIANAHDGWYVDLAEK